MTIRITVTEEHTIRRVRLEGRLSVEEIEELEQVVGDDPRVAYLDLAELRSVDAGGLALLRRLRRDGFEMRDVPPHLAWRIEEDAS